MLLDFVEVDSDKLQKYIYLHLGSNFNILVFSFNILNKPFRWVFMCIITFVPFADFCLIKKSCIFILVLFGSFFKGVYYSKNKIE